MHAARITFSTDDSYAYENAISIIDRIVALYPGGTEGEPMASSDFSAEDAKGSFLLELASEADRDHAASLAYDILVYMVDNVRASAA